MAKKKNAPEIILTMRTNSVADGRPKLVVWLSDGRGFYVETSAIGRENNCVTRNPRLDLPEGFEPLFAEASTFKGDGYTWSRSGECYRIRSGQRTEGTTRCEAGDMDFEAATQEFREKAAVAIEKKAEAHEAEVRRRQAAEADKKRQAELDAKERKKAEAERERLRQIAEKTRKGELDDKHYLDQLS